MAQPPKDRRAARQARRQRRRRSQNLLSLLFLLATLASAGYLLHLWQQPQSPLNPLRVPTPLPIYVTATPDGLLPPPTALRFQIVPQGVQHISTTDCTWGGILGSVPEAGYAVRIAGEGLDSGVFSGSDPSYGPGGFRFKLGDAPAAGQYSVQLFDSAGTAVSEVVTLVTRGSCEVNAARVDFVTIDDQDEE